MTAVSKTKPARAVADLTDGVILATFDIAATPERVFAALTNGKDIVAWWGSDETYRTEAFEGDVRSGGAWRAKGRGSDGSTFEVSGEYLVVEPPRRLVQTWRADWDGGATTTVTYKIDPIEGGSRLTLRHEGFAGRPEACQGHTEGWEMVLGWLRGHVAPAAAPPQYFLCRLLPPRPTFPGDMTPAEGEAMQAHFAYWSKLLEDGTAVVYGPVVDGAGSWGLAVVRAPDEAAARTLQENDPTILAGLGFKHAVYAMPSTMLGRAG